VRKYVQDVELNQRPKPTKKTMQSNMREMKSMQTQTVHKNTLLKKNYALYPTEIARSQLKRPYCPLRELTHASCVFRVS